MSNNHRVNVRYQNAPDVGGVSCVVCLASNSQKELIVFE